MIAIYRNDCAAPTGEIGIMPLNVNIAELIIDLLIYRARAHYTRGYLLARHCNRSPRTTNIIYVYMCTYVW